MWFLYIVQCKNGPLYTGITDDLARRFSEHVSGKGGRYTSLNQAEKLVYSESHSTRNRVEKREQQIKRWSKAKKIALIENDLEELRGLSVSRD